VQFRVLGPLEVLDNGEPLALGGAKQRALLAVLLLNANEVVSSDRLIDELWGAQPPRTAPKSLQTMISQLRKLLEPGRASGEAGRVLVTRSPGYALRIEPGQLDLERFRRLASDGRQALADGHPEAAAETLREALDLWRGQPLADFAYEPFAQAEIDRLEELRLAALEDRIQADLTLGRHTDVVAELERLAEQHPLRERIRGQLMLALYRSGRQAEALEVYRDAQRALTEELGIEPSRELRELERAILEQDPALDSAPAIPERSPEHREPTGGAVRSESFVGRQRELDEFGAGLEDAHRGRMSVFLIAGEPGIGKSRLADEWTAVAEASDARVCWGRCWEAGGAPPYWPWVQALRAYIRDGDKQRVRDELAPGAADIAQMLPELHELFPDLPPPPSLDPEGARFRLFDSTSAFLRAAGEAQPLVLVLDDLHAADKPSLLLLQFLGRSLGDARVVVVGAYRDTEPGDALTETVAEIRREPVTRVIRLGGLDEAEVARVIESIGRLEPSDQLARAIHRETEGNPLFVSELVRLLAAEGRLEELVVAPSLSPIPEGIREVIGHRLRRLSGDCKRMLSEAAVLGREFRLDALGRISERPEADLFELLDEAERERVVVESPAGRAGRRFSHALIRDSLYGELASSDRRRLHRQAVGALEDLYGADLEPHLAEVAYHALEAAPGGEIDKAIDYARRAADQAAALLAFEEAARHYRMALEALALRPAADEATRCDLLIALGEAEARGGNVPAAQSTFLDAATLARRLAAPEQLARAALGYGGRWIWFRSGKDPHLVPLLEDALGQLPEGDSELRVMLLARLAGALRDHPVPERRAALTGEAVEIARRVGEPRTLAHAIGGTYSALSWPRHTDAWLEMAQELVRLGNEIGDKEQAFFGRFHAFGAHMVAGDVRAAAGEYEKAANLAQELRQPSQTWVSWTEESTLNLFSGRIDRADEIAQRASEIGSHAQGMDATYWYVINAQGWALRREQGRLPEILPLLESYVAEHPGVFIFRCLLTSVHDELGNEGRAREELERLADEYFENLEVGTEWFLGASVLAGVCASLDDAARAEPLHDALLPYADYNVYAHPEAAMGSASRPLGVLAATMSRWEEAERHFERALEMNARMGTRPWVAHTHHEYAEMLIRRGQAGDIDRACELLAAARDAYAALGMTSWQEAAKSEQIAAA
jgi:DNA-binding SARP family transcriptional activator